jgi:RNA 2',3'-cyclic 3'-phosphodiesterase
VRLFLAINFDAATRAAVFAAAAALRAAAPELAWVDQGRLHLTLKFLGEQADEVVHRVAPAMDEIAARHPTLPSSLGEFGAFPNFRRVRVVWIGMDGDPHLELLHHDVELACEQAGIPLDARPFRPHVTLARLKHPLSAEVVAALSRAAGAQTRERIPTAVSRIDLMCSTLGTNGAVHQLLHSSPLRQA